MILRGLIVAFELQKLLGHVGQPRHIIQKTLAPGFAFLVSYVLTSRQARFSGALAMYIAFLIWSWGMVILDEFGVAIQPFHDIREWRS